jgi:hypothetical protein
MAEIWIGCPDTGREFSTGIHTDKASFDALPDVVAHAWCPHCRREHDWRKRDARLAETIPTASWVNARDGRRS